MLEARLVVLVRVGCIWCLGYGWFGKRPGVVTQGQTFGDSPSSVMVPLLEPPLLLERGWEEADESESPPGGFGVGEGEGVSVGDVLLEVEELPDCGRFFRSTFCRRGRTVTS